MTTAITISPAPADALTSIQFIEDLDELLASVKCSCSASDDNPY